MLKDNFPLYAEKVLRIRTKEGSVTPFILNDVQLIIHDILEDQKAKTGKVRAIILKGRQQGCSTYVAGRYYHQTTHGNGIRTFILAHETDASSNLFEMVERYYEHTPAMIKPIVGKSNRRELSFKELESGYHVSTAGSKGTGRSNTVQKFHGSEVAFWPHAAEHAAGVLQAIPDKPGTECILESTANGMGNYYHQLWCKAVAGKGEFIPIFIQWFKQREYVRPIPPGFHLTAEEQEYMELYDLSLPQMAWRRNKIEELQDPLLFKQEYPATPDEAFQFSGVESFIDTVVVAQARKREALRSFGAVVAGFDPSQDGADRDAFIYRQGSNAFGLEYHDYKTFPEKLAFCERKLNNRHIRIDKLFIDYGGGGFEIFGMLKERGYGKRIILVNSGKGADNDELCKNKRAEMWYEMKQWFMDPDMPVSIPDDNSLHADIVAPSYTYTSHTQILLESKKDIKKRMLVSPDGGDALALTFAMKMMRAHVMSKTGGARKVQTKFNVLDRKRTRSQ